MKIQMLVAEATVCPIHSEVTLPNGTKVMATIPDGFEAVLTDAQHGTWTLKFTGAEADDARDFMKRGALLTVELSAAPAEGA